MHARPSRPGVEDGLREVARWAVGRLGGVRVLGPEYDETGHRRVVDVAGRGRRRVYPREVAALADHAQAAADLLVDVIVGERGRAIGGEPGDSLLQRVPIALAVGAQIQRLVGEPTQRVAERGRRLAGLNAAELEP